MKQLLVTIMIMTLLSCQNTVKTQTHKMEQTYKYTNKLINENSPYLIQHAHNPVNWYPWGDEALQKAKDEDKLILVSIGYSACHWCHVMEYESFENEDIAKVMNDNFICIKVDREERPDVDNIYMTAVQLITGRGGWPLNCIALPDGRPVYGGTYFKPGDWKKMLLSLSESYKVDKKRFLQSAENIQTGIEKSEFNFNSESEQIFSFEKIKKATEKLKNNFDYKEGGFNRVPKFPMPAVWKYLTEYAHYSKDEEIKKHVLLTLEKIANGGIYDHLAGGFARYSVDAQWKVPHFEKMLYDNAQLLSLYSIAYKLSENFLFEKVVKETSEYIINEMTSSENAFYSSYDADSEREEGKFYVWSKKEIDSLLKDDSGLFCDYYDVSQTGNWEHGNNILLVKDNLEKILQKYKLSEEQLTVKIEHSKQILSEQRNKRIKPGLDDKILTSWNALMIIGFLDAYEVFGDELYLNSATKAAEFIKNKMLSKDFALKRSYKDGNSKINAFSDDYSFTVEAFIKLYQATGKEDYLMISKQLTDYMLKHFYDKKSNMFFYTSDINSELSVRQKEVSDNVIPASNSSMAKNLYILGLFFTDEVYMNISEKMTANIQENTLANLNYFANWASLSLHFSKPSFELIIIGKKYKEIEKELRKEFRPDIIFAGSENESKIPIFQNRFKKGKTLIYVCENNVCNQPVKTVKEAKDLLRLR
ncbi:MAG: thioredoxin domain-containing protein [Bacteroidales bacterium]|nr:thioredoxin domain-containing protein [Bacteroidales bacterium]